MDSTPNRPLTLREALAGLPGVTILAKPDQRSNGALGLIGARRQDGALRNLPTRDVQCACGREGRIIGSLAKGESWLCRRCSLKAATYSWTCKVCAFQFDFIGQDLHEGLECRCGLAVTLTDDSATEVSA